MSWRCQRFRPPGVEHVSVWDLPLGTGLFWERVGASRVAALRRAGVADPAIAASLAGDLAAALERLQARLGFGLAWLGGGLLGLTGLTDVLARTAPCPVAFCDSGRFVGLNGGSRLLTQRGQAGGAIVDVGQSAIKACAASRRVIVERDLVALPLRLITPDGRSDTAPPGAAASFIAAAVTTIAPSDPCVLLALPGPLGDTLVPGPCSYGWQGDATLVPGLLRLLDAGLPRPGGEVFLLNDAELAALSARADTRVSLHPRILALTLGFGPGAALC